MTVDEYERFYCILERDHREALVMVDSLKHNVAYEEATPELTSYWTARLSLVAEARVSFRAYHTFLKSAKT